MSYEREIHANGISHIDATGNMHYEDGRVWRHGKCYNSIISGCPREVDWERGGTSYCRQCAIEYEEDIEKQNKRDKFEQLCALYESMELLPKGFSNWTPPGMYPWQAAALADIRSDYTRNVWLHAEKGNGKTYVAYTVLQGALWHGIPVAYIDCSGTGLGSVCRNHNARKAAATVKTLVLDDVSRMYVTEYAAGELHNLLSDRNTAKLRTLVFDEKSGKHFRQLLQEKTEGRFGASTVERLSWKGAPVIAIEMKGRNLRME